jgi:GAF domain-containing protein
MKYSGIKEQLEALTDGVPYPVANMANAAALIWASVEDLNWAGFYTVEDGQLVLGPFQGNTACIIIPMGRGVCGTAAAEGRTVVVENVHDFPGHIACDSASNSEIVVPIRKNGAVAAVLDIDSPLFGRFGGEEKALFESLASVMEKAI